MIRRQKNKKFELVSKFQPAGDQEQAIKKLTDGFEQGEKAQILEGATGTGKTFTMANVIAKLNKPTLVISHNKTLVGQLYGEFKEFFPKNAVDYLCLITITINQKLMYHNLILILRKIHQLMMKLINYGIRQLVI